mmetsp:Transcript_43014/g.121625  ORF Transcript_43014/g.121625 Transcript_43014/m.121625 type:complete len:217 (-) Transcript_43014:316-966(-)
MPRRRAIAKACARAPVAVQRRSGDVSRRPARISLTSRSHKSLKAASSSSRNFLRRTAWALSMSAGSHNKTPERRTRGDSRSSVRSTGREPRVMEANTRPTWKTLLEGPVAAPRRVSGGILSTRERTMALSAGARGSPWRTMAAEPKSARSGRPSCISTVCSERSPCTMFSRSRSRAPRSRSTRMGSASSKGIRATPSRRRARMCCARVPSAAVVKR